MLGTILRFRSVVIPERISLLSTLLGIFLCLLPVIANMASAQTAVEPLAAVVKSVNDFTMDLYLAASKMKGADKNVLVSPLSAALVTAMVHAGAQGETAADIARGLHLPLDKDLLERGFADLHKTLAETKNVTLEIANRVYVEQTRKLRDNYLKKIKDVHNSDVTKADFLENFEKERTNINQWVSTKTHDKINDLLAPGILSADSRLVLVNALYFHGMWKEQFDVEQTFPEDFFVNKDKTVKVPMMHMTKNIRYAEIPELDAKAVELRYANENVSMQIILPNEKDGLAKMQQKLQSKEYDLSQIEFYPTKVQLSLPKFKLEETVNIKDLYASMGITHMFSDQADLSGMLEGNDQLKVSDAVQKTFMEVNEEGTEAAAATACLLRRKRCLEQPLEFVVDHPFMLKLVNSGIINFIGCYSEPTIVEDEAMDYSDIGLEASPDRTEL